MSCHGGERPGIDKMAWLKATLEETATREAR